MMMMIIIIKAMQGRQGVGGYACDKGDIVIIIIPIIVKVRPRIIIHACNSGQGAGGDGSNAKGKLSSLSSSFTRPRMIIHACNSGQGAGEMQAIKGK